LNQTNVNKQGYKFTLIGTIGRLTKVKAQSLLLESFAKLHDQYSDTGLVIAGTGQLEEEIVSNGWLVCPAESSIIFADNISLKYEQALNILGVDPLLLSADSGHA